MSRLPFNPARNGLREMFANQGFPLEKIGALILGWAMLEHEIEIVVWQLGGWPEPDTEPQTDRMPASQRIAEFRRLAGIAAETNWPKLRRSVDEFADAADNICSYRNAVAHGYPVPAATDGKGSASISNTTWNGEKRRRKSQTAHLDDQVLDMMLEALYLLLRAIHAGRWQAQEEMRLHALLQAGGLSKARSMSGEARHLTELMNHERY